MDNDSININILLHRTVGQVLHDAPHTHRAGAEAESGGEEIHRDVQWDEQGTLDSRSLASTDKECLMNNCYKMF